uniref:Uncharacterized protein n=1 Tax=Tanacetum cinerariifolium TaxID=118510 RepID=A0A6L2P4J0_TANCI|nr:hypothetical protein [Tanacetum cinerariifolium]
MRPFGCPITILNTIDHLGKSDGKVDEVFFIGYSLNSKAFRVFNSRTMIVEENFHIRFSESTPNVVGSRSDWQFDMDALTGIMNYEPILAGTQSNGFASTKACDNVGQARKETYTIKDYILLPLWTVDLPFSQDPKKKEDNVNSTNNVNTISLTVNTAGINEVNVVDENISIELPFDPNMPALEDVSTFNFSSDDEDDGAVTDMNNLDTTIQVNPIPITRIHKDHPLDQVIGDLQSAPQTRKMSKNLEEHGFVCTIQQRTNHKDLQNYSFTCFLSWEEPKKVIHALKDPSWIEAMQEELLQFKLQEVCTLVYLPNRKRAIGTKWVFRNKEDERGIMIRNKARLVAQEKIKEVVYVCQPPGFEDPYFLDRVYKVEKALYGLHQAPRAWFTEVKTTSTPMETQKSLLNDEDGKKVDVIMYRSMIGSLMYLTYLRPDIMFAVCACARYQVNLKVSNLHVVKRILAYTDSDYVRASLDRKSTTGGYQFLECRLISWQCKKQRVVANSTTEAEYVVAQVTVDKCFGFKINYLIMDGKEIVITKSSVRRDHQLADEEGSTMPTDPHHTPTILQPSSSQPQKKQQPRKPTRKDTQVPHPSGPTKFVADEAVHKELGDRLVRAATTASSLEAEQHSESSGDEESLGEDASKQGRIDAYEDITLVNVQDDADKEMFDVDVLGGEEMFVVGQNENVVEEVVDVAQVKGIVFQEPGKSTTTTTIISSQQSQDKGKGIMIEKPMKPKKKDQIRLHEEVAKSHKLNLMKKKDLQEKELRKKKEPILP